MKHVLFDLTSVALWLGRFGEAIWQIFEPDTAIEDPSGPQPVQVLDLPQMRAPRVGDVADYSGGTYSHPDGVTVTTELVSAGAVVAAGYVYTSEDARSGRSFQIRDTVVPGDPSAATYVQTLLPKTVLPIAPAQSGVPAVVAVDANTIEITLAADPDDGGSPITRRDLRYSTDGGTSWNTVWHANPALGPFTYRNLPADTDIVVEARVRNDVGGFGQGIGAWSLQALAHTPAGGAAVVTVLAAPVLGAVQIDDTVAEALGTYDHPAGIASVVQSLVIHEVAHALPYTILPADDLQTAYLSDLVTPNAGDPLTVTSDPVVITYPAPVVTAEPAITPATGPIGTEFTVDFGAATDAVAAPSLSFNGDDVIGQLIGGKITPSAAGMLSATASYSNSGGSVDAAGPATAAVTLPAPVLLNAPSWSGEARVGAMLTGIAGQWSYAAAVAYQWQSSADGLTGWADIGGETALSITPAAGLQGLRLRRRERAINATGQTDAFTPFTPAVAVAAAAGALYLGRYTPAGYTAPLAVANGSYAGGAVSVTAGIASVQSALVPGTYAAGTGTIVVMDHGKSVRTSAEFAAALHASARGDTIYVQDGASITYKGAVDTWPSGPAFNGANWVTVTAHPGGSGIVNLPADMEIGGAGRKGLRFLGLEAVGGPTDKESGLPYIVNFLAEDVEFIGGTIRGGVVASIDNYYTGGHRRAAKLTGARGRIADTTLKWLNRGVSINGEDCVVERCRTELIFLDECFGQGRCKGSAVRNNQFGDVLVPFVPKPIVAVEHVGDILWVTVDATGLTPTDKENCVIIGAGGLGAYVQERELGILDGGLDNTTTPGHWRIPLEIANLGIPAGSLAWTGGGELQVYVFPHGDRCQLMPTQLTLPDDQNGFKFNGNTSADGTTTAVGWSTKQFLYFGGGSGIIALRQFCEAIGNVMWSHTGSGLRLSNARDSLIAANSILRPLGTKRGKSNFGASIEVGAGQGNVVRDCVANAIKGEAGLNCVVLDAVDYTVAPATPAALAVYTDALAGPVPATDVDMTTQQLLSMMRPKAGGPLDLAIPPGYWPHYDHAAGIYTDPRGGGGTGGGSGSGSLFDFAAEIVSAITVNARVTVAAITDGHRFTITASANNARACYDLSGILSAGVIYTVSFDAVATANIDLVLRRANNSGMTSAPNDQAVSLVAGVPQTIALTFAANGVTDFIGIFQAVSTAAVVDLTGGSVVAA